MDSHTALTVALEHAESDAMADLRARHREQLAVTIEDHRSDRVRQGDHANQLLRQSFIQTIDVMDHLSRTMRALAAVIYHHRHAILRDVDANHTRHLVLSLFSVSRHDVLLQLFDEHTLRYGLRREWQDFWRVIEERAERVIGLFDLRAPASDEDL